MIEFIISYSNDSFDGVTEGEAHMYAHSIEHMREILRSLGVTCSFSIRAAKTKGAY